jgi:N-acetylmuramoyl-L-alanine amidase
MRLIFILLLATLFVADSFGVDYSRKNNPLYVESDYIKVLSYENPIKIAYSPDKMKIKFSTFYKNGTYYKIFDIYNAKISSPILKKLSKNYFLRIVRFAKNRIRVVIYAKKKFVIRFYRKNGILKIVLPFKKKSFVKKTILNKERTIVIDPGHGGKDPGAIGLYSLKEKKLVLAVAKYLKEELNRRGYPVYLTRQRDRFVNLKERTKFANQKKASLFISLHCNMAPHLPNVYGIETYFLSPARSDRAKRVAKLENSIIGNLESSVTQNIVLNFLNKNRIIESTKLAIDIQKSLIYNLQKHYSHIKDGGVRPAPFWVLVGPNMPAILIETGYLSNKIEAKRLNSKTYQKRLAKYIADGIENYFRKNP